MYDVTVDAAVLAPPSPDCVKEDVYHYIDTLLFKISPRKVASCAHERTGRI